jgi:hypothetical protein
VKGEDPKGKARYVYGTRSKKWHKIYPGDRDYKLWGLTKEQMERAKVEKNPKFRPKWWLEKEIEWRQATRGQRIASLKNAGVKSPESYADKGFMMLPVYIQDRIIVFKSKRWIAVEDYGEDIASRIDARKYADAKRIYKDFLSTVHQFEIGKKHEREKELRQYLHKRGITDYQLGLMQKSKTPKVKHNPLIEFYHYKFMTSQSNRERDKYYRFLNKEKENPNDEWLVKDILLMIQNEYDLWEKWLMRDWKKNFERKIKKGVFKKELAIKGLRDNFVPRALTKVKKEGLLEQHIRVSKDIKHKVAKDLVEDVLERIKWEKEHGE